MGTLASLACVLSLTFFLFGFARCVRPIFLIDFLDVSGRDLTSCSLVWLLLSAFLALVDFRGAGDGGNVWCLDHVVLIIFDHEMGLFLFFGLLLAVLGGSSCAYSQ